MRLFVAIEIPKNVRKSFAARLDEFRAISPTTKWVRLDNLHLTLKFLGETDVGKLPVVQSSLATIRSPLPVTLEFRGLGFFPNAKRPRVFWAGIQSSPNLQPIASAIDQALHTLGLPLEDRIFTPHLTLARFNQPGLPAALQAAATEHATHSFGSFMAREFHLIESKLKSTGAEYTTIQRFSFAPEA